MDGSVTNLLGGHGSLYLLIAAVVMVFMLARRVRILGTLLTIGLLAVSAMVLMQRASFDPALDKFARMLDLGGGGQQVVGSVMRIPIARDGHFWVRVRIGDVERRMLVDSGATVTALSSDTAAAAGLDISDPMFPMVLQTANGSINAQTGKVGELRIGNIVARDVPVVVSPAFGDMNVLGMNFLSRLKSWRVEDGVLILEPHHPQSVARAGVPAA